LSVIDGSVSIPVKEAEYAACDAGEIAPEYSTGSTSPVLLIAYTQTGPLQPERNNMIIKSSSS